MHPRQAQPAAPQQPAVGSSQWVADHFVQKYYDILANNPHYLHRFFKEGSSLTVTEVEPDNHARTETAVGDVNEIQKVISNVQGAVVSNYTVDAQKSMNEGVLLQVVGTMHLKGHEHRFVQTFFLATQEKGYYVLNDVLRVFPAVGAPEARAQENGVSGSPFGSRTVPMAAQVVATPVPTPVPAPVPAPAPEPVAPASPVRKPPQAVQVVAAEDEQAPARPPQAAQPQANGGPPKAPQQQQRAAPASPQPPVNLTWAQRLKPPGAAAAAEAPRAESPAPAAGADEQPPLEAYAAPAGGGRPPASRPPPQQQPQQQSSSAAPHTHAAVPGVFVTRLPVDESITNEQLQADLAGLFSRFGAINNKAGGVRIKTRQYPNATVRQAHVYFEEAKAVQAALAAGAEGGEGISYMGKPLKVDELRPLTRGGSGGDGDGGYRQPRQGSFSGGGRGGGGYRGPRGDGGGGRGDGGRGEGGRGYSGDGSRGGRGGGDRRPPGEWADRGERRGPGGPPGAGGPGGPGGTQGAGAGGRPARGPRSGSAGRRDGEPVAAAAPPPAAVPAATKA